MCIYYLRRNVIRLVRGFNSSVFIHLPFGLLTSRSFPFVKHHCFLHPNDFIIRRVNVARRTCGLPIARSCGSVGSTSSDFSFLSRRKEKPLLCISLTQLSCKFCKTITTKINPSDLKQNHSSKLRLL